MPFSVERNEDTWKNTWHGGTFGPLSVEVQRAMHAQCQSVVMGSDLAQRELGWLLDEMQRRFCKGDELADVERTTSRATPEELRLIVLRRAVVVVEQLYGQVVCTFSLTLANIKQS
jgi:hypothetical protein